MRLVCAADLTKSPQGDFVLPKYQLVSNGMLFFFAVPTRKNLLKKWVMLIHLSAFKAVIAICQG